MTFITQNVINNKKAFTLIELLVVIILITTIYAVFLPNFSSFKISTEKITLKNIKTYLKKNFDYQNELRLSCTENICYVYVDNKRIEDLEIKNLLNNFLSVYENDDIIEFNDIKIDHFSQNVIFEIVYDYDYKSKSLVLELDDLVYYYDSMEEEARLFEDINSYKDYKENLKTEVKDAF